VSSDEGPQGTVDDDSAAAAGESRGETIGLLAGNGRFPLLFAREARSRGFRVVAVAHRGETDPTLDGEVDEAIWVRVGQLGRMIRTFRAAGVKRAVMAGGIDKVRSFTQVRPDLRGMLFLRRAFASGGQGDDALLRALAAELEGEGIEVVSSTIFLDHLLATPGRIAGPRPSAQALADVRSGMRVLAALGSVDVGQSVVVERGVVLAVEAVEGTDEAVRRAGRLGRGSAVVVKAAKLGQDMRFDVPAVGPVTIGTMAGSGATVLAVEAGATLLLDREQMVAAAADAGIAVVGCSRDGAVAGLSPGNPATNASESTDD
jgi:DUF1009 family protein